MTIQEVIEKTGAKLLTEDVPLDREVTCGYACDLLSWVMSHGEAGMIWITVQTHMNVIAVASLADMSAVLVPENIRVEQAVADKAREEGVAILVSDRSAYELSGLLYAAGVKAR